MRVIEKCKLGSSSNGDLECLGPLVAASLALQRAGPRHSKLRRFHELASNYYL